MCVCVCVSVYASSVNLLNARSVASFCAVIVVRGLVVCDFSPTFIDV